MATKCMPPQMPPDRPSIVLPARIVRPTSISASAPRMAARTPHLSDSPPNRNIENVMPQVRNPTIGPAWMSVSPT